MKKLQSITLVVFCTVFMTTIANAEPATQSNKKAIEAVIAGRTKVAYASWWGFNPADSTTAIQSAINSGASVVIIEKMESPWITNKINLVGNQEIVFEYGVVVLAKKGEFKRATDALFTASQQRNITLTGYGATLQMRRADYDAAPYQKAEWRNAINIWSCSNVTISGLTIKESGGDGIYLGVAKPGVTNKDVLIKDVICDRNYRQGISIISAENLLIEDSIFKATHGTAPMAGVDFEPNFPDERLVNCVLRNCVVENNTGYGYLFSLTRLNRKSEPVSIRFENCSSSGKSKSLVYISNNNLEQSVSGKIEFKNCTFESAEQAIFQLIDKPATVCGIKFSKCVFSNSSDNEAAASPINFIARAGVVGKIGGIDFDQCTVKTNAKNSVMAFTNSSYTTSVKNITGRLRVEKGNRVADFLLTPQRINQWLPAGEGANIKPYKTDYSRLVPMASNSANDPFKTRSVRRRFTSNYVVHATKNDTVLTTIIFSQLVKYGSQKMPVTITAPSGKIIKTLEVSFDEKMDSKFIAPKTGVYQISCEPKANLVTVFSTSHRLCFASDGSPIRLLAATGDFFFWVPSNTKQWGVVVSGGGGGENINATLFDSSGKSKWSQQSISKPTLYVNKSGTSDQGEIWRLTIDQPTNGRFEDHDVQLIGLPSVISLTRKTILVPGK